MELPTPLSAVGLERPQGVHQKRSLGEWLLVAALLVLALGLRLILLDRAPPGVRFDELVNVKMADHIYAGEWPIYFQEAWGHEPLYHYFHALGMRLLGQNILGVRITSILFGVLGVFTAYLVSRQLFGRGVATVAAVLLAVSFWSLMYSRIGLRHISLPPWIGLAACCFWQGLTAPQDRRARILLWFALGGICLGAMLYTYFASRVVPVIFAAFALYLALFHRSLLRGRWLGLLLFFALAALLVMPMVLYLRQHPELEQRLGQVGGGLLADLGSNVKGLFGTIGRTLGMFGVSGDPEWLYNISKRPVFSPGMAVLFYLGVILSAWHWRDPRRAFILVWLGIGLSPAMLSWPPASLGHTIAAQPVAFVFPALTLTEVLRWGRDLAQRRDAPWVRWGARALCVAAIGLFALRDGTDYLIRWPGFDQVRHEYQAPITDVARYLNEHPEARSACVSAPYVDYWNPWSQMSFELFYRRPEAHVRWFDGTQSAIFPGEGESLVFVPDHILLPSGLEPDLRGLLLGGATQIGAGPHSRDGPAFDLYRWTDTTPLKERLAVAQRSPLWASTEGPYTPDESEGQRQELRVPLEVGARLSLLGYGYDRDTARAGESWQLTTYWRVLDGDSDPLAIFVHVLDDDNVVRAGWDGLYVSVTTWQRGDVFVHKHTLDLPADMPQGRQRVEIGVYSPPTLARLPLHAGGPSEAAPHDRVLLQPLNVQ